MPANCGQTLHVLHGVAAACCEVILLAACRPCCCQARCQWCIWAWPCSCTGLIVSVALFHAAPAVCMRLDMLCKLLLPSVAAQTKHLAASGCAQQCDPLQDATCASSPACRTMLSQLTFGAWGKTNLTCRSSGAHSAPTGAQPSPESPSPCSMITVPAGKSRVRLKPGTSLQEATKQHVRQRCWQCSKHRRERLLAHLMRVLVILSSSVRQAPRGAALQGKRCCIDRRNVPAATGVCVAAAGACIVPAWCEFC